MSIDVDMDDVSFLNKAQFQRAIFLTYYLYYSVLYLQYICVPSWLSVTGTRHELNLTGKLRKFIFLSSPSSNPIHCFLFLSDIPEWVVFAAF